MGLDVGHEASRETCDVVEGIPDHAVENDRIRGMIIRVVNLVSSYRTWTEVSAYYFSSWDDCAGVEGSSGIWIFISSNVDLMDGLVFKVSMNFGTGDGGYLCRGDEVSAARQ